jgi:hypothetical protein
LRGTKTPRGHGDDVEPKSDDGTDYTWFVGDVKVSYVVADYGDRHLVKLNYTPGLAVPRIRECHIGQRKWVRGGFVDERARRFIALIGLRLQ